ncbi:MAG: CHASE2 domain-containing protein [Sphingomonas sp.]|uniref:CHASE2 domain-containing protein n=1 Tax=Sphingomonas sp. TaxID=28214 RepID=UPI001B098A75|nr:CHASE2 domain-containing protein [Sphingomonas sp.]MBO9622319.1 CHASE2 domain-containing protein [Sphingomonas sp.]
MVSRSRRIFAEWLTVAILATGALALAVSADLFRRGDNLVYDRLTLLARQPASEDIIIVAIDDESIGRLGNFPWPRDIHARLLDRLQAAGPRVILYDVLFVDPTAHDAELARAAAAARPILPLYVEVPGRNGEAVTVVEPIAPLRAAGASIGHANLSPDEDGIVRRVHLAEGRSDRLWPHVAALAACRAAGVACALPKQASGEGLVRARSYLIPFSGARQHYRTVPFSAVLEGGVPAAFFRDKIVLVGATGTGLSDAYATPLAEPNALMPGVELNANIVQALISGRAITPAASWLRYAVALGPLWILLAGFLRARPRFNFLLGLALAAGIFVLSAGMLLLDGIWASPVAALAGLVAVYPLWGWRRLEATTGYMHEELERFRRDPDLLLPVEHRTGETVQTEIDLLRGAIARARDLQHFIADTLKGLPDASIVIGADGHIRMLNDRAHELLGAAEGRHFSPIVAELANDSALAAERAPGKDALPAEIRDRHGRIFDVRWSPIRDREGALASWVLRLADVTEFRTATRQREEALQLLTHDMRSPQASILTVLRQSRDAVEPGVAKRIEGYARRTLALADGFVQLARAEAQPIAFDDVDLHDVVLDAVDDLWPQSSARRMPVETHGCDEEVLVRGDRGLLTRAVINLVGNAIKYAPEASTVRCGIQKDRGEVTIWVHDEGAGLTEAQVALLFQPFRRLNPAASEGAGLGLTFVRSVAERHGGTVSCRSKPGEGTRFELRIPYCPGNAPPSSATGQAQLPLGAGRREAPLQ